MEMTDGILRIGPGVTATLGIIVLFVGKRVNEKVAFLREFSIPEPVTGGLLFSILFGIVYAASGVAVEFDLAARNFLLVYFFTTIGINASFKDLLRGGKPLVVLLVITVLYMVIQNLTGVSVASLFGLPAAVGVLGGTASLIGGHGTTIAWAPTIAEEFGIKNALEIGIACATTGLILASLMGGPIAKYLITKHRLEPATTEPLDIGVSFKTEHVTVDHVRFLHALLAVHISILIGFTTNEALEEAGVKLPLFVTCLFAGIVLTNTVPYLFPKADWPSRTTSMALIGDIALGMFLAMSLMSMQLWTLVDLAGPIIAILGAQFLIAVAFTLVLIFRIMGRDYEAAVVCAGFGGISLGATPTSIANMTAVTKKYGAAHRAFIIVPLVAAFFIDIVNAFLIRFFLNNF